MKTLNADTCIRNINISLLTNTKLEEPYLSILKELDSHFKDLNKYQAEYEEGLYPHASFHGKTNENIILIYTFGRKDVLIDIYTFYYFMGKFRINSDNMRDIFKWYLGKTFKHINSIDMSEIRTDIPYHIWKCE